MAGHAVADRGGFAAFGVDHCVWVDPLATAGRLAASLRDQKTRSSKQFFFTYEHIWSHYMRPYDDIFRLGATEESETKKPSTAAFQLYLHESQK